MTPERLETYRSALRRLQGKGRHRVLARPAGADFTSNDYLGLAAAARLGEAVASAIRRGVPVGAGGSRLLRGNHHEHEALEQEAAAFFGAERMLYFGSGYAANVAIFSALPQRGDLVVHDQLIHASAHEGIAAGRATAVGVAHNDLEAFEHAINKWRQAGGTGRPWIAVESLYSMDGDRAPLAGLIDLAERFDGFLVVDEAHATGVWGNGGRGLASDLEGRDNVITLHTCGKALGAGGALVGASPVLCDHLVNHARPFIYATAPSPLVAAAVREALSIVSSDEPRRRQLLDLVDFASAEMERHLGVQGSGSQILPVIIGAGGACLRIAARMRAAGFDIRAIRPPTVPVNSSRLRITVTLNVDRERVSAMFSQLAQAIGEEA